MLGQFGHRFGGKLRQEELFFSDFCEIFGNPARFPAAFGPYPSRTFPELYEKGITRRVQEGRRPKIAENVQNCPKKSPRTARIAKIRNGKSAQTQSFWARHPADVRADIRADDPARNLERRKIKRFARTSLTRRRGHP